MSRRIEIELTSARPDGTWTWRAAGAREPKGVLEGNLLPPEAAVGQVLRADADFLIDGIAILAVLAPKDKKRSEPERLEILGSPQGEGGVTTQLVPKRGRGPGGPRREGRDGPRREGRDGPRRESRDGPRSEGRDGPRRESRDGPRRDGREGPRRDGRDGPRRDGRDGGKAGRDRRPRREDQPAEGAAEGTGGERAEGGRGRPGRSQAGRPAAPAAKARGKRLTPANVHRTAVLEELSPEERAVAEQVLRGGIPAVRTALHLEREKAEAEGRPAPDTDALITLAERLLPRLRSAEWRDRAEAAMKTPEDIGLRDLRAVVTGADQARDDESRAMASDLRELLEKRLTTMRETWEQEIRNHLAGGRTIRAVRLSGRPPEPSSRLSAEILDELTGHANATLGAGTAPDAWLAMLEAVAASPIRRGVKPEALPAEAGADLQRQAQQQAGRVPGLASLLGLSIPPPPGPRRRIPAGGPRPAPPRSAPGSPEPAPEAAPDPVAAPEPTVPPAPEPGPEVIEPPASAPPVEQAPSVEQATAVEEAPPADPPPALTEDDGSDGATVAPTDPSPES